MINNHRFYDTYVWRSLRAHVLNIEPLCRHCAAKGQTTAATQVDHIKPIEEGGSLKALDNLQPLCDTCHSRKTRKENEQEKAITQTLGYKDAVVTEKEVTKQGKKGKRSDKPNISDISNDDEGGGNIFIP